jgi:hypothetical protein
MQTVKKTTGFTLLVQSFFGQWKRVWKQLVHVAQFLQNDLPYLIQVRQFDSPML